MEMSKTSESQNSQSYSDFLKSVHKNLLSYKHSSFYKVLFFVKEGREIETVRSINLANSSEVKNYEDKQKEVETKAKNLNKIEKTLLVKLKGASKTRFKNISLCDVLSKYINSSPRGLRVTYNCWSVQNRLLQVIAVLEDEMIKEEPLADKRLHLQYMKILKARENNPDFELQLAKMILGINEKFPPRRSYYNVKIFFDNLEIECSLRRSSEILGYEMEGKLKEINIKQIYNMVQNGLFARIYFKRWSEKFGINVDNLILDAKKEFAAFIQESVKTQESSMSSLLDMNNADLLFDKSPESEDLELNKLIEDAKDFFQRPNARDKQIALEKIWDAFERLKTYFRELDKKRSTQQIIDKISNETDKEIFEKEFLALTSIGNNNYSIRHHETDKKEIKDAEFVKYLFFRVLGLIEFCLRKLQ